MFAVTWVLVMLSRASRIFFFFFWNAICCFRESLNTFKIWSLEAKEHQSCPLVTGLGHGAQRPELGHWLHSLLHWLSWTPCSEHPSPTALELLQQFPSALPYRSLWQLEASHVQELLLWPTSPLLIPVLWRCFLPDCTTYLLGLPQPQCPPRPSLGMSQP